MNENQLAEAFLLVLTVQAVSLSVIAAVQIVAVCIALVAWRKNTEPKP
jgi:hypothetical protein